MSPWNIVQLGIFALGVVFLLAGDKFSLPLVFHAGFALMGITAIVIGLEAAVARKIVLRSRYSRREDETFVGAAAIGQGILFVLMGVFFVVVAFLAYFDTGRAVFLKLVRRPGPSLLIAATGLLATAITAFAGSMEEKQGPAFERILNLLASRLLPGVILTVLALGAAGLGLLEILTPQTFDQMGGGFLEVLFGAR